MFKERDANSAYGVKATGEGQDEAAGERQDEATDEAAGEGQDEAAGERQDETTDEATDEGQDEGQGEAVPEGACREAAALAAATGAAEITAARACLEDLGVFCGPPADATAGDSAVTFTESLAAARARLCEQHAWRQLKDLNTAVSALDRAERRTVLRALPQSIQLETTGRCNAACIMCNHLYAGLDPNPSRAQEVFDRLRSILPESRMVLLHGNGEPFLEKGLADRIRTFAKYGIALTTNTNLSVLPDDLLAALPEAFFEIRVSCDACTQEAYEGIRRGLSFGRFVRNLERLRDAAPDVRKVMVAVLMRQNICQVQDIVEFAADYGFAEVSFQELGVNAVIGNQGDSPLAFPHLMAHHFRLARAVAARRGVVLDIPGCVDLELDAGEGEGSAAGSGEGEGEGSGSGAGEGAVAHEGAAASAASTAGEAARQRELARMNATPFFPDDAQVQAICERANLVGAGELRPIEQLADCSWQDGRYACQGICEWLVERPYIDCDGNVFPCCINATYSVGNLFDYGSFAELWNNQVYQDIRRSFYEGRLPAFCEGCQFLGGGAMNYVRVKDLDPLHWTKRHVSALYREKAALLEGL